LSHWKRIGKNLEKVQENSKLDIRQVLQKQGKSLKFYCSQLPMQNLAKFGHWPSKCGLAVNNSYSYSLVCRVHRTYFGTHPSISKIFIDFSLINTSICEFTCPYDFHRHLEICKSPPLSKQACIGFWQANSWQILFSYFVEVNMVVEYGTYSQNHPLVPHL